MLLAGQEVVWVPARLTAAHRKLHAATGAKSDPFRDLFRRATSAGDPGVQLEWRGCQPVSWDSVRSATSLCM
jgi:hypothetical protein